MRMDYSEYLRQKKLSQKTYIHRQVFMDAGLHTYIKQKAADKYYVSPNSNPAVIHTDGCCPTRVSMGSTEVEPVKPASGCASAGACAQLTDVYTTPYIVLPCCPVERPAAATYKNNGVIGGCYCYQGTPSQLKTAVGDKLCCASNIGR
jgi:hypothetical protein